MSNPWNVTPADVTVAAWPDDADLADATVETLLDAAQRQCEEFAPALPDGWTELPAGYALAVIYQARELHNAAKRVGDSELIGDAAYPIRVRPLSNTVKALLRPPAGRPRTG